MDKRIEELTEKLRKLKDAVLTKEEMILYQRDRLREGL